MGKRVTLEQFIEKARKVHGNKYDYSKVEYIGTRHKVCIICPIHGEFWQEANSHLKGCDCPKCALSKQAYNNVDDFIKRSIKIHHNKYDYSKVTFNRKNDRIEIICPIHGSFITTPHIHLKGCNCPKCVNNCKDTKETFIEKAKKIHGDKYDYSKVEYKGSKTKICIICPEHGEFWVLPSSHLQGCGCSKCAKTHRYTTDEWIEEACKIHNNKYNYSKVEYVNNKSKVCIICSEHGEFWMTPNSHLMGQCCPKCAYSLNGLNKRLATKQFIEKAKKVHGDKYDYSKVKYEETDKDVCIICPEHGEFWQRPHNHLQGQGCPKCRQFKLETDIKEMLDTEHINYIFQCHKRDIEWLGLQSLDFYLPYYNIAIECQGEQHFHPVDFAGKGKEWAEEQFILCQKRDARKKYLCQENGVELIYYTDRKTKGMFHKINQIIRCLKKKKILKNLH